MQMKLLVLDKGEIKERGTHESYWKNGIYRRIYNIQYQDREEIMETVSH